MQIAPLLKQLVQTISPGVPDEHRLEIRRYRFDRNIRRIFVIGLVLGVEQAAYGVFVASAGTVLQGVYFGAAIAALMTAAASFRFLKKPPDRLVFAHHILEYSPTAVAMALALVRPAILSAEVFRLPTIYIAVIYVVAVAFLLPQLVSFVFYVLVSAGAIVSIPQFHPTITQSSYVADIVSNGAIAWVVSAIIYRSFVSDFGKTKTIETKNRELEDLSVRDRLTGLYNRRKLDSVLEEVHARSERYDAEYSLIIVDIDHFKLVNDNRGHHTGDIVLREISRVLADNIREVDTCGRWGGEEFLIICPETDLAHGQSLAERLRGLVESAEYEQNASVTASFGVASSREADDAEDLIRVADARLYRAKERGRNRVVSQ